MPNKGVATKWITAVVGGEPRKLVHSKSANIWEQQHARQQPWSRRRGSTGCKKHRNRRPGQSQGTILVKCESAGSQTFPVRGPSPTSELQKVSSALTHRPSQMTRVLERFRAGQRLGGWNYTRPRTPPRMDVANNAYNLHLHRQKRLKAAVYKANQP